LEVRHISARCLTCATRRRFSGVRTVRGRPGGFLLTMDAVVLNCVTQFNIVWRVGTFPCVPMSKCRRKTHCVTVVKSFFIFKKNVSTSNARCSSDQRCMTTEGFKPLYPAMCVLPRRHGAKFKSSNCFCPTLYYLKTSVLRHVVVVVGDQGPEPRLRLHCRH
jgi:hypothetical protein